MKKGKKRFAWSLWLPVTLAFLMIIGAWTTFIVISINHPTETVSTEKEEP